MKYVVLDPPEREIDPTQLSCCVYSMISFSTLPLVKPKPKIEAIAIKAKMAREKSKESAKANPSKVKHIKGKKKKVAA